MCLSPPRLWPSRTSLVPMLLLLCSGQEPILRPDARGRREQERVRLSAAELQCRAVETFQQRHPAHLQGTATGGCLSQSLWTPSGLLIASLWATECPGHGRAADGQARGDVPEFRRGGAKSHSHHFQMPRRDDCCRQSRR